MTKGVGERKWMMDSLGQRMQRAAERILENEDLTADLDDDAAKVLLDWGVHCAEQIARDTFGLSVNQAEEAMYPRLRALRRLMRTVNGWAPKQQPMDAETLTKMLEQAAIIYRDYVPPDRTPQETFQQQSLANSTPETIARLRAFIEGQDTVS
jgi:transposase InsO family protein